MMTMEGEADNKRTLRGWVTAVAGILGLFSGLCTLFALVVTVAQAWQEHTWTQWPVATAQVQSCGLDIYTYRSKYYWIKCSVSYLVHGEEFTSRIHSRTTPAPERVIWQYPPGQFDRMQHWVDEHPQGMPIKVHYDPANRGKAVLVETDMPLGGLQTPNNLKLLEFFALSCVVLVTIARMARPRPNDLPTSLS